MPENINQNLETNYVHLIGTISENLSFSHEIYGEKYYQAYIRIFRLSHISDTIPLTIPERLLENFVSETGDIVEIFGQYRSYNNYSGIGNRLLLTVFVKEISVLKTSVENNGISVSEIEEYNQNFIYLSGFVCKEPTLRKTPLGREISDVLLAVNRAYNKSDYLPVIVWGRNATLAYNLPIGANIQIEGRIQSREYKKVYENGDNDIKTAYEISVSNICQK